MDQVQFYLEAISHYVVMGLEMVGGLLDQFALGANSKWLGALVAVALLLVGFAIRGLFRSFFKNPRTTIFFVVLLALIAAAWYFLTAYSF